MTLSQTNERWGEGNTISSQCLKLKLLKSQKFPVKSLSIQVFHIESLNLSLRYSTCNFAADSLISRSLTSFNSIIWFLLDDEISDAAGEFLVKQYDNKIKEFYRTAQQTQAKLIPEIRPCCYDVYLYVYILYISKNTKNTTSH